MAGEQEISHLLVNRGTSVQREEKKEVKKREKGGEGQEVEAGEEEIKEVSPPSPSPTEQPAPAQLDSPLGWFDQTIPQLDGCESAAKCWRSPSLSLSLSLSLFLNFFPYGKYVEGERAERDREKEKEIGKKRDNHYLPRGIYSSPG